DTFYSAVFDSRRNLCCDERAVGRKRYRKFGVRRIACDLKNIRTEQRLAAGEHKHRLADGGDLVNELPGLVGCQVLRGELVGDCNAPAVDTAQITAGSCLPKNQARRRIKHNDPFPSLTNLWESVPSYQNSIASRSIYGLR